MNEENENYKLEFIQKADEFYFNVYQNNLFIE